MKDFYVIFISRSVNVRTYTYRLTDKVIFKHIRGTANRTLIFSMYVHRCIPDYIIFDVYNTFSNWTCCCLCKVRHLSRIHFYLTLSCKHCLTIFFWRKINFNFRNFVYTRKCAECLKKRCLGNHSRKYGPIFIFFVIFINIFIFRIEWKKKSCL